MRWEDSFEGQSRKLLGLIPGFVETRNRPNISSTNLSPAHLSNCEVLDERLKRYCSCNHLGRLLGKVLLVLYVGFFRSFALELIHFINGLNTAMHWYGIFFFWLWFLTASIMTWWTREPVRRQWHTTTYFRVLCIYIYIYICVCVCVCVCVYTYDYCVGTGTWAG